MNPAVVRTEPNVVDLGSFLRFVDMFTVSDPDADSSVIRYQFRDNRNGAGEFRIGNNTLEANVWHDVTADQARSVRFYAASAFARETFSVRVLGDDGVWSNIASGTITSGNSRPELATVDGRVRATLNIAVSPLVDFIDQDNDPDRLYRIVDRKIGGNGGQLVLGDERLAQGEWHLLSGAEFSVLQYEGALSGRDVERLTVEAYDGFSWSEQQDFFIATTAPTVITGIPQTVLANTRVPGANFFSTFDADADQWRSLYVVDRRSNADGGYWEFKGERMPSAQWFLVRRQELSDLYYVGGTDGPQIEDVAFQVYDGFEFSTVVDVSTRISVPPVVEGTPSEVKAHHYLNIGTGGIANTQGTKPAGTPILEYSDADGDLITEFMFVERNFNSNGGHFLFNGVRLPPATWFRVGVDELENLEYRGGEFGVQNENIGVRAYANGVWGEVDEFNITTLANEFAPTLNLVNAEARTGTEIELVSLFTWEDLDGDAIEHFRLYDTGDSLDGNYFTVDGIRQPAKTWIQIDWEKVGDVKYVMSDNANEELFRMTISDNRFTSTLQTARMTSVGVPVIDATENDLSVDSIERVSASSLITQLDLGPSPIQYQVYDENTFSRSGRLELDGVDLQQGVMHTLTADEFDRLVFKGAEADFGRQLDPMLVRADNGVTGWTEWERINVNTDPIGPKSLETGTFWTDANNAIPQITYQFLDGNNPQDPAPTPYVCTPATDPDDECNEAGEMAALNRNQRETMREVFDYIEQFIPVNFVEKLYDDNFVDATMLLGAANLPDGVAAWAYLPSGDVQSGWFTKPGDIWFDRDSYEPSTNFDTGLGSSFRFTAFHEVGHTLGLGHPFDTAVKLSIFLDFDYNTVMSYTHDNVHNIYEPYAEQPSSMMLYDIMELQRLYGANMNHNVDNNQYGNGFTGSYPHFISNDEQHQTTLWDAGGTDTFNYTRHVADETIDLREGTWSSVNGVPQTVRIMYGAQIENARGGSGDDNIRGNEIANLLFGNNGDDTLRGGGDNDVLRGGAGNDTYIWSLGDGRDSIREEGNDGVELLQFFDPSGSINSLEDDFVFRRFGNDLRIDVTLNQGEGQGTVTIKDFEENTSAVELMSIHDDLGRQIGNQVDLFSIFAAADTTHQRFRLTDTESGDNGGFMAVPVI